MILAFDVSASMAADDLAPTRMEAAKSAARAFVQRQPADRPGRRRGVQRERAGHPGADDRPGRPCSPRSTGSRRRAAPRSRSGLQTSLSAIVGTARAASTRPTRRPSSPQGQDLGYHGSAAVILLSDGENTDGPDPLDVAEIASSAGVRVYPIGLGRPEGTVLEIDGFQVATALDEPLLREIAARTDGRYFAAADEQALAAVYDSIELTWTVRAEHIEVTAAVRRRGRAAAALRGRPVAGLVRAGGVAMGFGWPLVLLSLLVVPLLLGVYVWQLRRRRRQAVRYSSVALIRAAAPRRSAWRRHAPFALVLGALGCLGLAAARPHVGMDVPVSESAMILALDVSGSMCATDVEPNRLTAAQAAVRDFVQTQEPSTRIGLVLFSGFAQVAVAPTTDREPLLRAIDSVTTGRGTTIGAAILKSVDAIAEINPDVAPADPGPASASGAAGSNGAGSGGAGANGAGPPPPRAPERSRRRSSCCSPTAQHPGHQPGGGRRRRRRSRGAGLPDRVRHPQPDGDGLHGRPAGWPWSRRHRAAGAAAEVARNFLVADEDDAAGGGRQHRGRVLRGERRRGGCRACSRTCRAPCRPSTATSR